MGCLSRIHGFLRDNRFFHFAVRFTIFLSIALYAQYNPTLYLRYLRYVLPALFFVAGLVDIIFGKKLQAGRDRKRIANGKEAETALDVRRSMGIAVILFSLILLGYVFIL